MKVNLLINGTNDIRSGYVNVDPFANGQDERVKAEFSNLNDVIDDAECEEFVANDILDYYPASQLGTVLDHWTKKIKRGGTIAISFLDIRELSRDILTDRISIENINILIHGTQKSDWDYLKSTTSIKQIQSYFNARQFKVVKQRIENYKWMIIAQRM